MQTEQKPLILTLRLDEVSQRLFDDLRAQHFPPERNFLKAHLTLLHQLPNSEATEEYLKKFSYQPFQMQVTGLRHLGAGVAYRVESYSLQLLHQELSQYFQADLIPQDRQPFKPHITIQNKVTPEVSKELLAELTGAFNPFAIEAVGLDLWTYLGGPWHHKLGCDFKNADQ